MKFSDFICKDALNADLQSTAKEETIQEMVQSLVDAGHVTPEDKDDILKAVIKREELGSTGIGHGVAVPHTRHPSVTDRLLGAVAVSSSGVDFAAIDGEPVHLLFLLISPQDRPSDHLHALEYISRHLRDEMFCNFLKQAKSVTDITQLLDEADEHQFGNG